MVVPVDSYARRPVRTFHHPIATQPAFVYPVPGRRLEVTIFAVGMIRRVIQRTSSNSVRRLKTDASNDVNMTRRRRISNLDVCLPTDRVRLGRVHRPLKRARPKKYGIIVVVRR